MMPSHQTALSQRDSIPIPATLRCRYCLPGDHRPTISETRGPLVFLGWRSDCRLGRGETTTRLSGLTGAEVALPIWTDFLLAAGGGGRLPMTPSAAHGLERAVLPMCYPDRV